MMSRVVSQLNVGDHRFGMNELDDLDADQMTREVTNEGPFSHVFLIVLYGVPRPGQRSAVIRQNLIETFTQVDHPATA
jgi:hypothetical protein